MDYSTVDVAFGGARTKTFEIKPTDGATILAYFGKGGKFESISEKKFALLFFSRNQNPTFRIKSIYYRLRRSPDFSDSGPYLKAEIPIASRLRQTQPSVFL